MQLPITVTIFVAGYFSFGITAIFGLERRLPHHVGVCLKYSAKTTTPPSSDSDELTYDYYDSLFEVTTTERKPVYTCCDGYKEIVNLTFGDHVLPKCEPICNGCKHGSCIAPHFCQCHVGYETDEIDGCIAQCSRVDNNCFGGVCVTPNHCKPVSAFPSDSCNVTDCVNGCKISSGFCRCIGGYRKIDREKTVCQPICENNCGRGYCSEPDTCVCDNGYEFDRGFKRCVPICEKGCEGGQCVAPNNCSCAKGYSLERVNNTDVCVIVAGPSSCKPCPEISCIANRDPSVCRCADGYAVIDKVCTALCRNVTCINGYCSAPEKCSCLKNYRPSSNRTDRCEAICDTNCLKHGNCLNADRCLCDSGYVNSRPLECVPECKSSCKSGEICIAPNVCGCRDGYQWDNGSCVPICSKPCLNGFCMLPEICVCNHGYAVRNGSCVSDDEPTTSFSVNRDENNRYPLPFCAVTLTNEIVDEFFSKQFSFIVDYDTRVKNWTIELKPNVERHCSFSTYRYNNDNHTMKCDFLLLFGREKRPVSITCSFVIINVRKFNHTVDTCKPALYRSTSESKTVLVTSSSLVIDSIDNYAYDEGNKCVFCPSRWYSELISIQGIQIEAHVRHCTDVDYITEARYRRGKHFVTYVYVVITLIVISLVAALLVFSYRRSTGFYRYVRTRFSSVNYSVN